MRKHPARLLFYTVAIVALGVVGSVPLGRAYAIALATLSPTATMYSPPTSLSYCATQTAVATGTSTFPTAEIPTVIFPTVDYSTSLPPVCITPPGGGAETCYTSVPGSNTSTPTVTPFPTTTTTPTPNPSVPGFYVVDAVGCNGLRFDGGGHVSCSLVSYCSGDAVAGAYWSVLSDGISNWGEYGIMVRASSYGSPSAEDFYNSNPKRYFYANEGTLISTADILTLFGSPSAGLHSTGYTSGYAWPDTVTIGAWFWDVSDNRHGVMDDFKVACYGTHAPTSTPSPTPVVTSTPDCMPFEVLPGDTPIAIINPGEWIEGECFTILPEADLSLPEIPFLPIVYEETSIHVDGVQVCTMLYSGAISFAGFDVVEFGSICVTLVCVAILYREFRS